MASASVVVFLARSVNWSITAGQNVPRNGSSFDKLLLQTGCIDRHTERMRAIFKMWEEVLWLQSEVKLLMHFDFFFDLVILTHCHAIFMDFCIVKY